MINYVAECKYIESKGTKLFTVVLLPNQAEKFPVVVVRNPYVEGFVTMEEENIEASYLKQAKSHTILFSKIVGKQKRL